MVEGKRAFQVFYRIEPNFSVDKSLTREQVFSEETHRQVRTIEAEDTEQVYYYQQGEIWSPRGEQSALIKSKGLQHTSMSIGDVAYDVKNDKMYQVASCGFVEVP